MNARYLPTTITTSLCLVLTGLLATPIFAQVSRIPEDLGYHVDPHHYFFEESTEGGAIDVPMNDTAPLVGRCADQDGCRITVMTEARRVDNPTDFGGMSVRARRVFLDESGEVLADSQVLFESVPDVGAPLNFDAYCSVNIELAQVSIGTTIDPLDSGTDMYTTKCAVVVAD